MAPPKTTRPDQSDKLGPMAATRPPLATWKKLSMGLVVAGLALGGSEIGLRITGWGPAYRADFAGWRMPVNLDQHRMKPLTERHRFLISTNSDGLRTAIPREKTPGRVRLAVMGDSTAFGWGVDEGRDLATRLEFHLGVHRSPVVEVLNAAQPGYTSAQLFVLFEETVQHYQPDVVLFFPPQHDHTPALVSDWEHVSGVGGPIALTRVMLARHSRIYHLLWTRLSEVPGPDNEDEELPESYSVGLVPRVSDSERADALNQIASTMSAWDGRLVMGIMPFYPDLQRAPDAPPADGPEIVWIQDFAQSKGHGLVDVRRCCGPDADALVFDFDKWHLNQSGNDAVARALAVELREQGLLESAGTPP
jgi:hypothetical protein